MSHKDSSFPLSGPEGKKQAETPLLSLHHETRCCVRRNNQKSPSLNKRTKKKGEPKKKKEGKNGQKEGKRTLGESKRKGRPSFRPSFLRGREGKPGEEKMKIPLAHAVAGSGRCARPEGEVAPRAG
jgi:hypothetical protein